MVHDAVQAGHVENIAKLAVTLAQPEPGLAWLVADASAIMVDRGLTDELAEVRMVSLVLALI